MDQNKNNGIIAAVDFRLQALARQADSQAPQHIPGTTQLTIRIDNDLKAELDVVASFLSSTRNALINEFLTIAVEEARLRIGDNPYLSLMTVNGKTIGEAVAAAFAGEVDTSHDIIHDVIIGKITPEQAMEAAQK